MSQTTAPADPPFLRSQWTVAQRCTAVCLFLVGCLLILGGTQLLLLGGSFYYLIAGIAVFASSVLLWLGRRLSIWLYGLFLLGTSFWSLWEVGLDGWALMPRMLAPTLIFIWLLAPSVRRGLR